jgi:hypothetical protein
MSLFQKKVNKNCDQKLFWSSFVLEQLRLGAASSWSSFVLEQLRLGAASSWSSFVLEQLRLGAASQWSSFVLIVYSPAFVSGSDEFQLD